MDQTTELDIRERYPNFTDGQIRLISIEAYDRGHSAGQEEVNAAALSIAAFTNEILEAG